MCLYLISDLLRKSRGSMHFIMSQNKENFSDHNKSPNPIYSIYSRIPTLARGLVFSGIKLNKQICEVSWSLLMFQVRNPLKGEIFWDEKALSVTHLQIIGLFSRLKVCSYPGSCGSRTSHITGKCSRCIVTVSWSPLPCFPFSYLWASRALELEKGQTAHCWSSL